MLIVTSPVAPARNPARIVFVICGRAMLCDRPAEVAGTLISSPTSCMLTIA